MVRPTMEKPDEKESQAPGPIRADTRRRERRVAELSADRVLEEFERLGRSGFFAGEPDFPRALADFRAAIEKAKRSVDPPWEWPPDFMDDPKVGGAERELAWRDRGTRFPDVNRAFVSIDTMIRRVEKGPPVIGEAEFNVLADWFDANRRRIVLSIKDRIGGMVDLGDGRFEHIRVLEMFRGRGIWHETIGKTAKDLRRLKERFAREDAAARAKEYCSVTA